MVQTTPDLHRSEAAPNRRARQLVDDLKQTRIPRQQLVRTLTEAFSDPDDPPVYKALLRWVKNNNS
ncbi:hypothetical protein SCYAM73S_05934 [Streptomyces cyaneofuscatus]